MILDLCANFQLSSMIGREPSTTILDVHTWRTLMVPEQLLEGSGHPSCHISPLNVILDLGAKFQLTSMIRSASRTPVLDIHTWRMLKVPDQVLG